MTEKLPHLSDIERLSPRVIRILGGNPGKFTLQGTNTYLVGTGSKRILIDTGEGQPAWKASLQRTLAAENACIEKIILTHWHPDHVGGVQDALAIHSCASAQVYKSQLHQLSTAQHQHQQHDIADNQRFAVHGATLHSLHCPGHTVDHMALVLEEEGDAMFTGDNVLGHGTAVFEDLAAYMASLERMRARIGDGGGGDDRGSRAYPGHGEMIADGRAKMAEYIAHRREREEQVLGVLRERRAGGTTEGWSSMALVKIIYREYPESLHGPAQGSVVHVLKKMQADGKVKENGDGTWSLMRKAAL